MTIWRRYAGRVLLGLYVAVFILALFGCSPVYTTQNAYTQSYKAYRACLKAKAPGECEREKALMLADEQAFKTTAGVWMPGYGGTVNVNQ